MNFIAYNISPNNIQFSIFLFTEELVCKQINEYAELLEALHLREIEGLPPGGGLQSKWVYFNIHSMSNKFRNTNSNQHKSW